MRSKILGDVATDITREDRTIDIRLRAQEQFRDSAADLRNLNITQTGTTPIPLSAVASVVETEGPAEIRRSDGERAALITANLVGRDLASASAAIQAELEDMTLPMGFDWRMGGQQQEMETSFASMRFAILLAVFMVYLVMASQFESLLHPLVILFSVPFSLIGVLVTLYLLNVTVSVVVLIGVHHARRHRRQQRDHSRRYHEPTTARGQSENRSVERGRNTPVATDSHDDVDDRARTLADGDRTGRGERASGTDGDHRDWRPSGSDTPHARHHPSRVFGS